MGSTQSCNTYIYQIGTGDYDFQMQGFDGDDGTCWVLGPSAEKDLKENEWVTIDGVYNGDDVIQHKLWAFEPTLNDPDGSWCVWDSCFCVRCYLLLL